MATSLDLSRTYTSFSGVDIRVVINGRKAGSMQALSYAIQREKAPIYVMGSVDPVSYSRGKRGIAGTMISLMMDVHMLYTPSFTGERYLGDRDEVFPSYENADDLKGMTAAQKKKRFGGGVTGTNKYNAALAAAAGSGGLLNANNETGNVGLRYVGGSGDPDAGRTPGIGSVRRGLQGDTNPQFSGGPLSRMESNITYDLTDLSNNYRVAKVFYVDQILPFDVTIVAANEYGQSAQMRLYGCEILNEGSGFSIDDIVIENQMTYVCRTILPWRSFDLKGTGNQNVYDELYDKVGDAKVRGAVTGNAAATDVSYN